MYSVLREGGQTVPRENAVCSIVNVLSMTGCVRSGSYICYRGCSQPFDSDPLTRSAFFASLDNLPQAATSSDGIHVRGETWAKQCRAVPGFVRRGARRVATDVAAAQYRALPPVACGRTVWRVREFSSIKASDADLRSRSRVPSCACSSVQPPRHWYLRAHTPEPLEDLTIPLPTGVDQVLAP